MEINGWSDFFAKIIALCEGAERQHGIANLSYSEYIIERLELCITTCSSVLEVITSSTTAVELQECTSSLKQLIECLQRLYRRWDGYKSFLEGSAPHYRPMLATQHDGGRGRPRFQVDKSQLEYLASLSQVD